MALMTTVSSMHGLYTFIYITTQITSLDNLPAVYLNSRCVTDDIILIQSASDLASTMVLTCISSETGTDGTKVRFQPSTVIAYNVCQYPSLITCPSDEVLHHG